MVSKKESIIKIIMKDQNSKRPEFQKIRIPSECKTKNYKQDFTPISITPAQHKSTTATTTHTSHKNHFTPTKHPSNSRSTQKQAKSSPTKPLDPSPTRNTKHVTI